MALLTILGMVAAGAAIIATSKTEDIEQGKDFVAVYDGEYATLMTPHDAVKVLIKQHKEEKNNKPKDVTYTGYVLKSKIDELNLTTVSIPANFAGLEAVDVPTRLREQLFEIVNVDEGDDEVTITARHIWYTNIQNNTLWKPTADTSYSAAAVCRNVLTNAIFPSKSNVASDCTDTLPAKELDFERKNLVECFLDPEKGICKKFGLSLIRDNMDFYCLKNVGYNRGFIVESGKNLLGVERQEDIENVVTRIAPIGKNYKGEVVWMNHNGLKYIDSPHIGEYFSPRLEILDTGLQYGKDGVTPDNMNAKLLAAAQKRFTDDEVDIPEVTMTVEFISLGDTEEYSQYRGLDKVYLYDILTIKDPKRSYNYSAQVIGVEHDILTGRLNSVTIGTLKQADSTRKIAVWQVPEVDGANIRLMSIQAGSFENGAIQADDIAEQIIEYAHLASATIDSLTADAITAVQAEIQNLIAGKITADSIDADSIDAINAKLGVAEIADAEIQNADIDYAQIKDLAAETAIFEHSITEQGIAEKLFINRLMISYGQMVQATIGDLVIGASNGNYYHIDVVWDANGVPSLTPTQVSVSAQEIENGRTAAGQTIISDVGTYADLSAENFYAINSIIDRITAKRIDVDQLFAREATIAQLNTVNISNNQYIGIAVRQQLGQGKEYTSETAPANPEIGDVWHKVVHGENAKTWEDLESYTWEELESFTWHDLMDDYYETYRYDEAGWILIDGAAQARIDLVNDRIDAFVDDGQGAISGVKINPNGIDLTGDKYIKMKTGNQTNMELSRNGIDMNTAGKVNLHGGDGTASSILFGDDPENADFYVGNGGDMKAQTAVFQSLVVGGAAMPGIIVSERKPTGHNILWFKPSSTTEKTWTVAVTGGAGGNAYLDSEDGGWYYREYACSYAAADYLAGNTLRYGISVRLYEFSAINGQSITFRAKLKNGNSWIDIGSVTMLVYGGGYYVTLDATMDTFATNVMDVAGGNFTIRLEVNYPPTKCRLEYGDFDFKAYSSSTADASACTLFYLQ